MSGESTVIIKTALRDTVLGAWEHSRVFLFSAPCGCGKTASAAALLRGHSVCRFNAADADFSPESLSSGCEVVLVDDLQLLAEPERQGALCELIRTRPDLHFFLLGRGRVPGWLMPFQFAGILRVIGVSDLSFDRPASERMLESRGIAVSAAEMTAIQRDMVGYPIAMDILCRKMENGEPYSRQMLADVKRELFVYYDEAVYHRFDLPLRQLLLCLAPFESFQLELARIVSGEPRAGELLGVVQRDTSMLLFDGLETYRFRPIFREFLIWELHQSMSDADLRILYGRAALYFELRDELGQALDFYSQAGETTKVSALLAKNAERHPGVGHYRELQKYYLALPREEILHSPSLMCGMSMLLAMCLDYEGSEQWYRELENYAARLSHTDAEYKSVLGKLAYLDIGLPQRGSSGLIDVIGSVFRVMTDKQMKVPAFSVTSMLPSLMNGGKDFCDWSKRDDLMYATMRRPVEAVLGRDGVGLADCAICESKFEKGEDVSARLLTLMSRLGEIQTRGTRDMEFAVVGLLARVQVSQGKARSALESIESLREKFRELGETRFLTNMDAMICRIQLRLGDMESVLSWLTERSPRNEARLWAMWRYQYLTRAMVLYTMGDCGEALLLLARLLPYCQRCGRIMDGIHIRLLTALCHERMGADEWKSELCQVLDTCREYRFIWPVAQYGPAVLPLLSECGWDRDSAYLERLTGATRTQAVHYPRLMRQLSGPMEPLSTAETQVLKLLCQNLSNQEIGEILNIKLPTVKTHVSHILQKLGVRRRGEARDAAEKLHLI